MSATVLPASIALRPWRSVHALGPAGRVLGLDPATALVVGDLPPALAELVTALTTPITPQQFVDRATDRGIPAADARTLLTALHDAGELVDAADLTRVTTHRRACAVVVTGRGPLAVGSVLGLVTAGVGAVHLQTSGVVDGHDLGTGLVEADRGRPRLAAVREAARRIRPRSDVTAPARTLVPDLVVLADETPDPVHTAALVAERTAHLVVRVRDGVGVVGPLVLPGRSACLACLDRGRGHRDAGWPLVAAQLVGRRGVADPACVAATAALGVAQAVAALDAATGTVVPPSTLETTLELDPTAGSVVRRQWSAVPDCPCGATVPPHRGVRSAREGH